MEKKYLYYLLKAIQNNSDFDFLIKSGFTYPQITGMIIKLKNDNLIKYKKNYKKIELTSLGFDKMKELSNMLKEKVILPLEKVKIPKIDKNYIYVPDKEGEFKPG